MQALPVQASNKDDKHSASDGSERNTQDRDTNGKPHTGLTSIPKTCMIAAVHLDGEISVVGSNCVWQLSQHGRSLHALLITHCVGALAHKLASLVRTMLMMTMMIMTLTMVMMMTTMMMTRVAQTSNVIRVRYNWHHTSLDINSKACAAHMGHTVW